MDENTAFEVGRLYGPIREIADTFTASQKDIFVRLPALIAYWPMGIRDIAGNVRDHSGAGSTLPEVGTCPVGYDGNSFTRLGNGTNYLQAGSGFGVTGLETWVDASLRGLTVGGWFFAASTPTSLSGIVSKWGVVPQRGYALEWTSGDVARFAMSSTGANGFFVDSAVLSLSAWHFLVGRFVPGTEVAIFANGNKLVSTAGIPASIFASSQPFEVGRIEGDNSLVFSGMSRDVFVCASALSDSVIEQLRATSVP